MCQLKVSSRHYLLRADPDYQSKMSRFLEHRDESDHYICTYMYTTLPDLSAHHLKGGERIHPLGDSPVLGSRIGWMSVPLCTDRYPHLLALIQDTLSPVEAGPTAPHWENGYIEGFNGRLPDELLNRELFDPVWEVQVLVERWRQTYNRIRPHSALGYRPPAPEAIAPRCA